MDNKNTRSQYIETINALYASSEKNDIEMSLSLAQLKATFEKAKDFNAFVEHEHDCGRLAIGLNCAKAHVNVGEFINAYGCEKVCKAYGYTALGYILPHCKGEKGAWNENNSKAIINRAGEFAAIPCARLKMLSRLIKADGHSLVSALEYLMNADLCDTKEKAKELRAVAKSERESEFNAAVNKKVSEELEKANLIDGASLLYELTKALSAVESGDKELATAAIKSAISMLK